MWYILIKIVLLHLPLHEIKYNYVQVMYTKTEAMLLLFL